MNSEKINTLIAKKIARQEILSKRKEQLETLERDLFSSKIGRFFGKIYYYIKRYITLALGVLSILFAIIYFVYPSIVFGETKKEDLLMRYKADYYEIANETIDDSVKKFKSTLVTVENSETATTELVKTLNISIVKTIEHEIQLRYKYMAFGLLFLGLLLIYISAITKKIHFRNEKITNAEALAKVIIEDYKLTIKEEAEELQLFRSLTNPKISDIISSPSNE